MANNFYQINNEILKLNPYNKKDLELIQFNHYLCRKENLQRNKGELTRGLFKLSYTTLEADTGLSRNKLQRIIKWFEDNNIIKPIHKSRARDKESIYCYTSVYYDEKNSTVFNTENNTVNNTVFSSNSNVSNSMSNTVFNTVNNTVFNTSKKEKKKEKEKENIKSSTDNIISLAHTKTRYTEKVAVMVEYNGLEVKATRFDGNPPRYEGNEYKEYNGYIYEIDKRTVQHAKNYWAGIPYTETIKFGGVSKGDMRNNPFKEIRIIQN